MLPVRGATAGGWCGGNQGSGRMRLPILIALCALATIGLPPSPASAARGLLTGFADAQFTSSDSGARDRSLTRASQAEGGIARLIAFWGAIAPTRPADPSNPADPAYDFGALDVAVSDAARHGLAPLLTVSHAPAWAEGSGRPATAASGSWRPQPAAFGQFGLALARRYSGNFSTAAGTLPRVTFFQAWIEPNLDANLSPQWKEGKPVAALDYRSLLNAFYAGVKSVSPGDVVVGAGTAPFGDRPGGSRTRPVTFWDAVLCVRQHKGKLSRAKCPRGGEANLDVLAHHPIKAVGNPAKPAANRDDASSADLFRITRILRAAERFGTVKPAGHRPVWATETWWETNPLDGQYGVPPALQARRLEQALYLIWKGGGSAAINLQVSDDPAHAPGGVDQTGVFLADGTPKPSLTAFRFPFVADRIGRATVRLWGKAPESGTLLVQRASHRGWRTVRRLSAGAGQVFVSRLHLRRGARLRASVGTETSLDWAQR
jgi:hypothetical protein